MDRLGTCEIPPRPRGRQPEPGLRRTKRPRLGRLLHPPGSASASTNPGGPRGTRSRTYVLALEGNQGCLHDDVRTFLDDPARPVEASHTMVDGDHGRIETRTSLVSSDIEWLQEQHAWPGLMAIGKVVRTREIGTQTSTETAYYLLSTALSAARFGEVARAHWGVENGLHWVLDVTMNEDQARNHKDHGPQNIALLRRLALNLAKLEGSRESLKSKLFRAALSEAFLTRLLAQLGKTQMR